MVSSAGESLRLATIKAMFAQNSVLGSWQALNPGGVLVVCLFASFIGFLVYEYTPRVNTKGVPPFTPDTLPVIGSWGFISRQMPFWRAETARSKTGNFSFWLGRNLVVGLSGESARKMYLEDRALHLIKGIPLIGHGPDFIDGTATKIHGVWKELPSHGGKTYAQRRLVEIQKTHLLAQHLPKVKADARKAYASMSAGGKQFVDPSKLLFRLVATQGCRIVATDQIVDDEANLQTLLKYLPVLQFTNSVHLLPFIWVRYCSPTYWTRRLARRGLENLVWPIIKKRMAPGAVRENDGLQELIDRGDPADYIMNFIVGMLFIVGANSGVISGSVLNLIGHHPAWQEKIYNEIKAAAAKHFRGNEDMSLLEMLDSLPLEAWDQMSCSLDLVFAETIRMWVAFPMGRYNDSRAPIPIPGTDEVIPPGAYACYNTVDVHYNKDLYPDPYKWNPDRWLPDRREFEREAYGYMGWGGGRHPCIGMRWAKIQQNINVAYALAMYKWNGCDESGKDTTEFRQPTHALAHLAPKLPAGTHLKFRPREG